MKQKEAERHRIETENWVMYNNQNWVLDRQVSHKAGNVHFERDREL